MPPPCYACTHAQMDGQPENIMLRPHTQWGGGGGIKVIVGAFTRSSVHQRDWHVCHQHSAVSAAAAAAAAGVVNFVEFVVISDTGVANQRVAATLHSSVEATLVQPTSVRKVPANRRGHVT